MTQSAKGTIEEPGKYVCQKAGLNRKILNHAWSIVLRMIEYKFGWKGSFVILIDPHLTSQIGSLCHRHNHVTQSAFACVFCDFECNTNWNATIDMLATEHALIACKMVAPEGLHYLPWQMMR